MQHFQYDTSLVVIRQPLDMLDTHNACIAVNHAGMARTLHRQDSQNMTTSFTCNHMCADMIIIDNKHCINTTCATRNPRPHRKRLVGVSCATVAFVINSGIHIIASVEMHVYMIQ